ncbi:MAG: beta-ketoacyl-ACP synthase [Treponema sp.]|jgi:3-oxoacyl-[acyl-carrier-protein] synthase-1|nr:beta-ketoacyl-ACP synthase [Treponema sp.]
MILLSRPGVCCSAGHNAEAVLAAVQNGDSSGITPVVTAGGRRFLAGRIPEEALPDIPPPFANFHTPNNRIFRMVTAAISHIREEIHAVCATYGPDRVAVCLGSCDNGSEASLLAHQSYHTSGAFPSEYRLEFQNASLLAAYTARLCGVSGPVFTVATACASSASAIIKAAELVLSGVCDAAIAGGADLVSDTVLEGFAALEAVSDTLCNPFSKNRRGITLGEGAAFFVVTQEALGHAEHSAKTAPTIALLGWGESADAHHMTAPRPDGSGAIRAMRSALAAAGLQPGAIDYLNLHGTGTAQNDAMEALAMSEVFGKDNPPASSTKPVTGHTLGAAGALELAISWLTLAAGEPTLPPHCWDAEYDEKLPRLRFAERQSDVVPTRCMSNSFAFGGCNVSLIVGCGPKTEEHTWKREKTGSPLKPW